MIKRLNSKAFQIVIGAVTETGFPIFLEMVLKPLRIGCRFKELPTDCHSRKDGESSNSCLQIPQYLRTALQVRFMPKENILKK